MIGGSGTGRIGGDHPQSENLRRCALELLAAWAWAERNGKDPRAFVGDLYRHVPVLDSGARGATTTFAQRGIGMCSSHGKTRPISRCKNSAMTALISLCHRFRCWQSHPLPWLKLRSRMTRSAPCHGLSRTPLFTRGAGPRVQHFYRAWDASAADPADVARFPKLDLVSIDAFGGWAKCKRITSVTKGSLTRSMCRNERVCPVSQIRNAGFGLTMG